MKNKYGFKLERAKGILHKSLCQKTWTWGKVVEKRSLTRPVCSQTVAR